MVVILVGMTAILIGSLSYSRARDALEAAAKSRLELLARDIAERFRGELDDRVSDITGWTRLEVMVALLYQDVDKELAQFLTRTLEGRRVYQAIGCFDRQGEAIARVGDADTLPAPAEPPFKARVSVIPRQEGSGGGSLRFEATILNPRRPRETLGTMVSLVDLVHVVNAITASVQNGAGPVAIALTTGSGQLLVRTGDGPADSGTINSSDNEGSITAESIVLGPAGFDAPTFRVVVSQANHIALKGAAALRRTLMRTGLVVLLLSAALGTLLAWRIVLPVRALTTRVREITERGEIVSEGPLPAAAGEVGVLSRAFQTMIESLSNAQRAAVAQSRLALLGEVAASLAHEVRTPLAVLKTSAQLLSRPALPAGERDNLTRMVADEVNRLNGIVTALLDLARPKAVTFRPQPLSHIIERALSFFAPMARQRATEIRGEPFDSGIIVHCNADQIHQVLLNLVYNALQVLDQTGIIRVSARPAVGGTVRVEVADNGPGFSVEALPRAFAPFFTTKVDGTGLGLAIAKRIVEEHGGTIGADNADGGGALLWFTLPVKEVL